MDDAFALSYAGLLDTTVAMNLSIYLVREREYAPWSVAMTWFYRLGDLLSLTPHYGQYLVSESRHWSMYGHCTYYTLSPYRNWWVHC